jgi:UDP-2,3-diacylglucosamine pyrophosphatase LpxH
MYTRIRAINPQPNMPDKEAIDTLIISDIHLGSPVSRAQDAVRVIEKYDFRRLILNGDIFDGLNFYRLKHDHWEFLSRVRLLSNPKRGVEVVWVEGNHDFEIADALKNLVGIEVRERYAWIYKNTKFLAMHGHQFDKFIAKHPLITNVASWVYEKLQELDVSSLKLSRYLKRTSKTWLRASEKISQRAVRFAHGKGVDIIICSHTHQPMECYDAKYRVRYLNTGCFTDATYSYVTVAEKGISLHQAGQEESISVYPLHSAVPQ